MNVYNIPKKNKKVITKSRDGRISSFPFYKSKKTYRFLKKKKLEKLEKLNFFDIKKLIKLNINYNTYFFKLNSVYYKNINSYLSQKVNIHRLCRLTIFHKLTSNYRKNFFYLKLTSKPTAYAVNKLILNKNLKMLSVLASHVHRYSYNIIYLAGSKFMYEVNALNFFNKPVFVRSILTRAALPSLERYFATKINKLRRSVAFLVDYDLYSKIANLNILIFNFLNSDNRGSGFFFTILIDASSYIGCYCAINFLYLTKNFGNKLIISNYMNYYSNFRTLI